MAKVRVKKGHNLFSAVIFNNTMRRRSFSELTLPETSITEFKVCFYPPGVRPSQLSGARLLSLLPSPSIWKKPSAPPRSNIPNVRIAFSQNDTEVETNTISRPLNFCTELIVAQTIERRMCGWSKKTHVEVFAGIPARPKLSRLDLTRGTDAVTNYIADATSALVCYVYNNRCSLKRRRSKLFLKKLFLLRKQ